VINEDASAYLSAYNTTGKAIAYIAAPNAPTLKNTTSGVQITWAKVTGAAKYRIFRKTGTGGWAKLADTTAVTYVDKTAKNGTKYSYTIRCITSDGTKFTSAYNTVGSTITCKR
jgi:fibronectin type 3 domain-containing protein